MNKIYVRRSSDYTGQGLPIPFDYFVKKSPDKLREITKQWLFEFFLEEWYLHRLLENLGEIRSSINEYHL